MMNCQNNGPQKRIEEIGDICDRSNSIDLLQKFFSSNSGAGGTHWYQLKMGLAVETAATQTKPAYAGFKNLDFSLVRDGGLRF